jgi:hypothetical protein
MCRIRTGTKFVLLTSLVEPSANTVPQKVYEAYADIVMKNPFLSHTPDLPLCQYGQMGLIQGSQHYGQHHRRPSCMERR